MGLKLFLVVNLMFLLSCGGDDRSGGPERECSDAEFPCEVFRLVNAERATANLPALKYHSSLALSAQRHAEDMHTQGYFSHGSPDGRDFSQRTLDAGYDAFPSGENIAGGQQTPEAVMQSWMRSPGHRGNILSTRFNEIGVGHERSLWVQVFGTR